MNEVDGFKYWSILQKSPRSMPSYNLVSPNGVTSPCNLADLQGWLQSELGAIHPASVRSVVSTVCTNLDDFVSWPQEAILLWDGCDRIPESGKKQKYFRFPEPLKALKKQHKLVALDTRQNGPAIAAFLIAGGKRHSRFGSRNSWHIHHLYSGKFPHLIDGVTVHAVKDGRHFTQSAGLVAVHPIADGMCDEFPFFTWYLRAEAFRRFGYDPDCVFGSSHDNYGFIPPHICKILHTDSPIPAQPANA